MGANDQTPAPDDPRWERLPEWLARIGPALLVALGFAALFAPVLFEGRVFFGKDAVVFYYPSHFAWREQILGGRLPLWLPGLDLGMPLLANPENAACYPLNALLTLPWPYAVGLFVVVHAALAFAGAFALLRVLGASRTASALGAAGFGLGGYVLSMTWSGVYLVSASWLPVVAALGVRLGGRRDAAGIALFALAAGARSSSGEIQSAALTWAFAAVLVAAVVERPGGGSSCWCRGSRSRRSWRPCRSCPRPRS